MTDRERPAPSIKPKTADERAAREARLALEMRKNLKKRKARQRAKGRGCVPGGERDDGKQR